MSSLNCLLGVFLIYLNCFIQFDLMKRSQTTLKMYISELHRHAEGLFVHQRWTSDSSLMSLLFSMQHIPSPSWLRRASWPIRPSRCRSSPSAADLHCFFFVVSPLWTLTAPGVQSPTTLFPVISSRVFVERQPSWSSEGVGRCALDIPPLDHGKRFSVAGQQRWQLLLFIFPIAREAFHQRGNHAQLLILPQYHNRRKERVRCSGKTLKTSAYFLHWWHTFAAILSFMAPSEKSYLLTVKLSIIKSTFICLFVKCLQWLYRVNTVLSF